MKIIFLTIFLLVISCAKETTKKKFQLDLRGKASFSLVNNHDYLDSIKESRLLNFITTFSSYKNRYYKSKYGVKAINDLASDWKKLTKYRNDISVKLFQHDEWPQPSIILTIKGSESAESIILGAHGDSINTDDEGVESIAPGADDNASGVAVLNEVLNVLIEKQYQPKHNIIFMIYAAEEINLQGSMEIAKDFATKNISVKGVLNFDGTNYNGSTIKFALIEDNTDSQQNRFIGNLIDRYIKVPWGYDKCHYACSDHYSWTYNGFKASFPAESKILEENPYIHTHKDTLAVSKFSATHATHFAKLGIVYILESDLIDSLTQDK